MFGAFNLIEVFSSFIVMAAIIDIFGSIPIFMGMKEQNKTIKAGQACLTALGLFLAFFFAGDALLKLFGIDKESFAVAGAFVLFILAVEMMALSDPSLAQRLAVYKGNLKIKIEKANEELAQLKYEYKTN